MKATHLAHGLSLFLFLGLASGPAAQSQQAGAEPALQQHLDAWRAENGANWRVRKSYEHGYARMLFGGKAPGAFTPASDVDYFALARTFVDRAAPLFDVANEELTEDQVLLLPLATIGSSDKVNVRFTQALNGVPVEQGSVNLLFTPAGELLSFDAQTVHGTSDLSTLPGVSAETALAAAKADFLAASGTPVTDASDVTLNVIRVDGAGGVEPALAWRVQVWNKLEGFVPESYVYQIAAKGGARVLRKDDAIHHFDVGGTVTTNATPGHKPDTATNPPVPVPAAYMTVSAQGAGTTTTDANGDFNFPGLSGPVNVTFRYDGLYNNVDNSNGGEYSLTQSLTGTGNAVLLNPGAVGSTTSQSNAFTHINLMRDWTQAVMPGDTSMDFVNLANVNINSSCNAFYDGSSTNYYLPGGGCVNTAYENVIYHEQGHWQNDRYGSGNGFDGFGEGNADAFGIYQADSPLVGEDFFGPGTTVRDASNLRQYCGDGNGGCYGQVHTDGEVLMGAFWKVREEIRATLGSASAVAITDGLFLGWMNAYDQSTIDSIIETQWLVLDDDNGDIQDGTPNYEDINDGFLIQGFPGVFIGGDQATAVTRNGTGFNPDVYTPTNTPILGQNFDSVIDANGIGTIGTFTSVFYYERPLDIGLIIGFGEVLVDPTSVLYARTQARIRNNGRANHSNAVPPNIALNGLPVACQGLVSSSLTLTNAIDLVIGTF